jgi:hypothetical protein
MGEPRLMQSGRAQEGSALLRSLRGASVQHRLGLRSALCIMANLPVRLPERVDAVEKVGGESGVRSNRINEPRSLNQRCANDWFLDSRLRRGAPKIFFNNIGQGR